MACDYGAIRRDNERRYGTDIGRIGPMLLADRYDDRTHFIYELLQNAEDALARVRIELGKKVLAILPETSGDSQQVLKIPIFREDLIGSSNLNIRIYKDLRDEDRSSSIGIISVADLNGSYSWNEFSNKDGTPLGQFQRLFVSSSINGIPFASQKRARGTLWPPNAED